MSRPCALRNLPEQFQRPHLPARLAELLDIDGAAQGDDEQREALSRQAVVADHGVQHLQGDLVEREMAHRRSYPSSSPQERTPRPPSHLLQPVLPPLPTAIAASLQATSRAGMLEAPDIPVTWVIDAVIHPELQLHTEAPGSPDLYGGLLRLREIQQLAQGHTASSRHTGLNPQAPASQKPG